MTIQEKVNRICEILKVLGEPGSAAQLAQILQLCPSTIARYMSGEVEPRAGSRESIDVLYRILLESQDGNDQAKRVLTAVIGNHGLLRLGVGGAMVALGMTWLVHDRHAGNGEKPCESNPEGPATKKSTSPRKASRKATKDRKPS